MRIVYHPKVNPDLSAIMGYYEEVATAALADEFYREFTLAVKDAAERPESFRVRARDLRRVNLPRFPFHFLFRIVDDSIRIQVVRHHKRHPSLGIRRR
jgi:plasmid stabilization system protein ParE